MKEMLAFGDSWTYGWDIDDPTLKNDLDFRSDDPRNDAYRIPKIWPTLLGDKMGLAVTNYSSGGVSNDYIAEDVLKKITMKLSQGVLPEDIFVVIGWSSPERRMFWEASPPRRFDLRPLVGFVASKPEQKLHELYMAYFNSPEEYAGRFINTVAFIQAFLNSLGIKWMCFNAFYHSVDAHIDEWDIACDLSKYVNVEHLKVWDSVSPVNFYRKYEKDQTFYAFVENNLPEHRRWVGFHPSAEAHALWANRLFEYCQEHFQ